MPSDLIAVFLRDYRVQPSIEPRISDGFTKENILTETNLPL